MFGLMTWKCLNKLTEQELKEVQDEIRRGVINYNVIGWEDIYPTNQDILNFII